MNTSVQEKPRPFWRVSKLAAGERFAFSVTPLFAIAVFLVASLLDPDPRGHGTHEQLGLMPCAAVAVLNTPCPFCGMTTSFSYAAHGNIGASFRTQPGGLFLFSVMFVAAALSLGAGITGHWLPGLVSDTMVRRYMWVGGTVLGLAWIYKIVTFT